MKLNLFARSSSTENGASPRSATLSYYAGTRRLRDLPDGRQVWQAYVGRLWRTYYEFPLDGTDLARIRGRLAEVKMTR
jgi:hypothetical protein